MAILRFSPFHSRCTSLGSYTFYVSVWKNFHKVLNNVDHMIWGVLLVSGSGTLTHSGVCNFVLKVAWNSVVADDGPH